MSILGRVTWKNLQKNPVRTLVTIIGILLSAAMITAVTTSVSSLYAYMTDCTIYETGNYHVCFPSLSADKMKSLKQESQVESCAWAQNIGYAKVDSKNDYKPYLYITGADALFLERMPIHLTEGRMPDNSREILLPAHLKENGKVSYALGDTLTLSIGDRFADGTQLSQFDGFIPKEEGQSGETLKVRESRTYTVVGIYERPDFEERIAPGYIAITLWDDARPTGQVSAYFRMKHPQEAESFVSDQRIEKTYSSTAIYNSSLLRLQNIWGESTSMQTIRYLALILILLIMFGSIALIYNAFSISVSERTKQFGLLSSLGATKKQLRRMVLQESFFVSLIGIPLGILSGIAGIAITFSLIGDKFYILYGVKDIALRIRVTPVSIVAAVLISFLTVLISAWIPSRRAVKLTAMEAIRQKSDIRLTRKDVKISFLTRKLFKLEGILAAKNFRRNRKRYYATILSLFSSIVLFIAASSYCHYLTDTIAGSYENSDHDISYNFGGLENEPDTGNLSLEQAGKLLGSQSGVTRYSYVAGTDTWIALDCALMPEETLQKLHLSTSDTYDTSVFICGVDQATYDRYCKELKLNKENLKKDGKLQGIVCSQKRVFNEETTRREIQKLLKEDCQKLTVSLLDQEKWSNYIDSDQGISDSEEKQQAMYNACSVPVTLQIGAFADSLPFGLNQVSQAGITVVYPLHVLDQVLTTGKWESQYIYLNLSDREKNLEPLKQIAQENGLPASLFFDTMESSEQEQNLVLIIRVFSYGFIILISLISLANVFNTISTSILLRRREFAMLRSVGMTQRQFYRMLSYECILYGIRALALGIPVAILLSWVMFQSVNGGYETPFYLPLQPVLITIGSVFLVVFTTMLYGIEKVKNDNLVETLRSETY